MNFNCDYRKGFRLPDISQASYSDITKLYDADELAHSATEHTIRILKDHGNKPDAAHAQALHDIQQAMSSLFLGRTKGRHVFDLPTAMGKTTAVRGFVHAVNQNGLKGRIVICCEKVKAICDLKKALIEEEGIPEDRICLIHSYKHDPDYDTKRIPEPQTAPYESDRGINQDRHQFVLITHSKLHGGFQNLSHSLLIYDEGLLLGKSFPLIVGELRSRLLALKGKFEADNGVKDESVLTALGWLGDVEQVLKSVLDKKDSGEIALPRMNTCVFDVNVEPYVRRVAKDSFDSGAVDLDNVIEFMRKAGSGEKVRIIECNGVYTVVFNPSIPETLQQLVILDASFNIRKINEGVDSLICHKSYADIKDCSDITIHFAKAKSGRQRIFSKLLVNQGSELIKEAATLTGRLIQDGKKVLLFIHKDALFNDAYIKDEKLKEEWARKSKRHGRRTHTVKPVEALTNALLEELGTDEVPEAVNIATWGYETAENKWGDADAVVFVTVNELPSATVYTRRIDQKQDPFIEISSSELRKMIKSEKANQILQALGRGGRTVIEGRAAKLDAYVFSVDWDELMPYLKAALHKVKMVPYEPITDEFIQEVPKKDQGAMKVRLCLDKLEQDTVSLKKLWKIVDPKNEIANRTRNRTIVAVCADPNNPWYRPERSRNLTRNAA